MSGRPKRGTKKSGQTSEARPRRQNQDPPLPQVARHHQYEDRLDYFQDRDMVAERGIALEELVNTPIPQMVERNRWQTFISSPPMFCRKVVEEFYSSLIPEDYQRHSTVLVRGVEVRIDIDDINRYFNTELPADQGIRNRIRNGVTWNELYSTLNLELANQLVIHPMEFWVAPDHRMRHTNLILELGFWHVFLSYSLLPRKHRTSVSFVAATVLHCILRGELIDIGYLIKREILVVGSIRVNNQAMIFPSLITAFCKEAGVDFGNETFDSGIGPCGRATWNDQLRERNPSGVRVRTGRKKPLRGASSSRQHEEVPEQEAGIPEQGWTDQDFAGFIEYSQMDQPPPQPSHEPSAETPWQTVLNRIDSLRIDVLENRKQIAESREEYKGYYEDIWGNLTSLRETLDAPAYPMKKKRPAPFSPPSRGPVIDPEAAALRAAMELSKKEHEERMRAEQDPLGKGIATEEEHIDSSDED